MFENFPYTNFHDLNLDWLLQKIMEAYSPENPPPLGLVLSVNGDTGEVILYKEQNVQLPSIPENSWNLFRLTDNSASGIKFTKGQPAERIDGGQRYQLYDTGNPPPTGAVASVDGMTGEVKTWANSNNATLATPTSAPGNNWELQRTLNNGDTIGIEFEYDTVNSVYKVFLKYTPSGGSTTRTELLTNANIPASGVVSINTLSGIVTLTGEDIAVDSQGLESIADALSGLVTALGNKYEKPVGGIPGSDLAPGVIPDISGKLNAPAQIGTAGQVLGLDNSLNPKWINQPDISGLQNAPAIPGSSGQVLGLDNSLNPVWVNNGNHRVVKTVVADGVKTFEDILKEFVSSLNNISLTDLYFCKLVQDNTNVFSCTGKIVNTSTYWFMKTEIFSYIPYTAKVIVNANTASYINYKPDGTYSDLSAMTPPNGAEFVLYI